MPRTYTEAEKAQAVELFRTQGATAAAKVVGTNKQNVSVWAKQAGVVTEFTHEASASARAVAGERVTAEWADYRSKEAAAAGATANRLRREVISRLEAGANGRELQAVATAYGIMIDKAEILSDRATSRIEIWAESEVDRELAAAMAELESRVREDSQRASESSSPD